MGNRALLLAPLLTLLAAAACGGSAKKPVAPTLPALSIKTIVLSESEYKLDPAKIVEADPGTYHFQVANQGHVAHALAIEGNGLDYSSEHIAAGKTGNFRVKITKPGTYKLYCPVDGHEGKGMVGQLVVGGTGAGSGGGTSTSSGGNGY